MRKRKRETAHDIVAADDGLITEMITRSGTPAVTVGTPVKKGRCVSQWVC